MDMSKTSEDVASLKFDEPTTPGNTRRAGLPLVLPTLTVLSLAVYSTIRFVAQVTPTHYCCR
jgi:hypothetical protein